VQESRAMCVLSVVTGMRLSIALAVLLAAAIAQAQDPFTSTFERLAQTDRFAFGGTGIAGTISQGERDYRSFLSRPSAMADFERLLSTGNSQAKSYALVGIRSLNLKRFRELSRSLRNSTEQVATQHGCIVSREQLKAITKGIEAGVYSNGE